MNRIRQQEGRRPSGPTRRPWTDSEIRIFLLEWEVVEQEVGLPGRNIHKKAKALCQRLYQRGLRKTWQSCFDLLLSLKNLHRTLCNERPRIEPLFSPYAEALYRILGHRLQENRFPGPLYDGAGNLMLPMCPQPPMGLPIPVYQPWNYGFPVPSGALGEPIGNDVQWGFTDFLMGDLGNQVSFGNFTFHSIPCLWRNQPSSAIVNF